MAWVLGSGFQPLLDRFRIESELDAASIPGFPRPRVQGHSGRLLVTKVENLKVLIVSGRPHFYEGHSMEVVMFPIRLLAECGVQQLVLTNAAGGINTSYQPGDFMLISDHINLTGVNPLRGFPVQDGRCFLDLSDAYCQKLRAAFRAAAVAENIPLHEGVYAGVSGPTYETPAEIRAFRSLGADAVGMSTVPEVLMARYCGMRVSALSCITNLAAGMTPVKLSHQEVLMAGRQNASNAARLLQRFAATFQNGAKS
jgi:purine-nucleoside phosphorylase